MKKILFLNKVNKWEEVEAEEVGINGRSYWQFTPRDGKHRLIHESNPCITSIIGENNVTR